MRLHQAMRVVLVAGKSVLANFYLLVTLLIGRMPDTKWNEVNTRCAWRSQRKALARKRMLAYFFVVVTGFIGRMPDTDA